MTLRTYLPISSLLLLCCGLANAQINTIDITVDENGLGTINGLLGIERLTATMQDDPGPGGLANILTYNLQSPPNLVEGDVLLQDADGNVLDVLRFNPNQDGGSLLFYSDNVDGFDSIGDTSGPPGSFYTNQITIPEVGTETKNGAVYIPVAGQPGFISGASIPVRYIFISEGSGPVPEPGVISLMVGLSSASLLALRRKKK